MPMSLWGSSWRRETSKPKVLHLLVSFTTVPSTSCSVPFVAANPDRLAIEDNAQPPVRGRVIRGLRTYRYITTQGSTSLRFAYRQPAATRSTNGAHTRAPNVMIDVSDEESSLGTFALPIPTCF